MRARAVTELAGARAPLDRGVGDYARIRALNERKFARLREVLRRLHDAGIDCLVLKGADVIPRLYGVLGARPLGDADLLVHERDLPAIDRIVAGLGYHAQIDGNPVYVDPEQILALDIITRIWYVGDADAAIWRRAVSRDFHGVPIQAMSASDVVVYLTAYSVIHRGYVSHAFAQDVALLIAREAIDWELVVGEAARCHLRVALHHGLSYVAARQSGTRIPADVLARLAPVRRVEHIAARALRKLVTDTPVPELGHLLLLLTRPGVAKLAWLRERLVPSDAFLGYRYGERHRAHPWRTRVVRGVMLSLRAQRLLARVVVRLARS